MSGNCSISSSISSSFVLENDFTSYSSSTKIDFDPTIFENHISAVNSDLESVNISNCEDSLSGNKLEDPNIEIEFEPFSCLMLKTLYFQMMLLLILFSRTQLKPVLEK